MPFGTNLNVSQLLAVLAGAVLKLSRWKVMIENGIPSEYRKVSRGEV
jgi:hypothetical protein